TRWRERAEKEDENLVVVRKEELRDFINMCRKEHKVSKKQIYECKKCDGAGYLDDNMLKPCPKCEGEGEIIKYDGPANPAWIKEGRTCLIEITRLEGFQNNLKVQHNHSGTVGVVKIDADNLLANADEETIIETKLLLEQLEIDQRKAKEKIIDVEPIEKEETDDGRAE
ncbi:hypothetical protein KAR91_51580, partial [Candidatus Pacearchaeota archaeon]|nr:hypothetical protein [Candidatus Pacearchaeota archaeon]